MNRKIILLLLCVMAFTAWAFYKVTPFVVQGKVTDEKGNPLSGVTISIKEEKGILTSTGNNGEFSVAVKKAPSTIVFSAVGFQEQSIIVSKASDLSVVLHDAKQTMQEVVVTGYGRRSHKQLGVASPGYAPSGYFRSKDAEDYMSGGVAVEEDEDHKSPTDREGYDAITENRFKKVTDDPLSTFSIDVDGASYSNVRRYLQNGSMPPAGAVRIEEFINYFHYNYPQPAADAPFSINTELSECPWNPAHKLALIGLQGKKIPTQNLPASNLVFLIDVSGSMSDPNKLSLVRSSLKLLVEQLREQDRVAIVVYAGSAGLVLPPTNGANKNTIIKAIDNLEAGGSTAGGAGIKLAYKTAKDHFIKGVNNRVILCTDGDFNVGQSSDAALEEMIEEERKSGVFLSVLGFGMGNYQDAKMQKLADKGNGNHSYIDGLSEARKVFVSEFGGTLFTIAKDVKLQIEFNPAKVQGYRLIGYENRLLNKEDFNNDKKDAGELGSGHTVTALYEIIPAGVESDLLETVDALKYQQPDKGRAGGDELMTVKFRYKKPDEDVSRLIVHPVKESSLLIKNASENFRFAAAVAQFGMLLRNSAFKQDASYQNALVLAKNAIGKDEAGYRTEFIKLLENAKTLAKNAPPKNEVGVK